MHGSSQLDHTSKPNLRRTQRFSELLQPVGTFRGEDSCRGSGDAELSLGSYDIQHNNKQDGDGRICRQRDFWQGRLVRSRQRNHHAHARRRDEGNVHHEPERERHDRPRRWRGREYRIYRDGDSTLDGRRYCCGRSHSWRFLRQCQRRLEQQTRSQ